MNYPINPYHKQEVCLSKTPSSTPSKALTSLIERVRKSAHFLPLFSQENKHTYRHLLIPALPIALKILK